MKIKASSINNLTDARYFAAWNVEWLGFSLEIGNSNYTRPQDVKEIKDWLVGPKIIGEFGLGQDVVEIQESINLLNLDGVQLSMFADDTVATQLQGKTTLMKEWILEDLSGMDAFVQQCVVLGDIVDYFCLDLEKNGITWEALSAHPIALEPLKKLCEEYAILISISCPVRELENFLNIVQPHGLSFQGGEEEKVGMKSFDDLNDLFEALEEIEF